MSRSTHPALIGCCILGNKRTSRKAQLWQKKCWQYWCGKRCRAYLTALLEAPEPERRTRRTPSEPGSVVGTVDKAALLQVIEEIEAHSGEAVRCADPLSVAHSEDISQWTERDRAMDGTKV